VSGLRDDDPPVSVEDPPFPEPDEDLRGYQPIQPESGVRSLLRKLFAPLLVLLGAPGIAAAVALAALTTEIYPVLYDPLILRRPPQYGIALACLSARNALLLIAYVVLVWRLIRFPRVAAPAGGKPDTAAAVT
jgi:hypothetical protein